MLALLPGVADGATLADRFSAAGWERFETLLPALRERAKTLPELIDGALFLVMQRPLAFDDKAQKQLDPAARVILSAVLPRLAGLDTFDAVTLEAAVRAYAEETATKLGSVAQPLRAALTGRTVSPPVFDVMAVLGREETLARLQA